MIGLIGDSLWRGWAGLLILSLASTLAAQWVGAGIATPLIGALILALAYFKARLILSRYLGLAATPFWNRGFGMVLGGYMAGLLVLYLIPLR
ncbi:nitric oxide reductase F protein [Pelagibius litoralis]|uniref:Nitric oxide reductase F protein n=1 Tax=Pelagibius litoralis TaxID=374515 RepID=A0A967EYI7_9PROT|nr:nitric oxide reductase F protein [Pelagibius litoralis]NIA69714.1 nitric oxide reductase F protein [Pelagibius litoralis]